MTDFEKEWKKYYSADRESSHTKRRPNVYYVGFYAGRDRKVVSRPSSLA